MNRAARRPSRPKRSHTPPPQPAQRALAAGSRRRLFVLLGLGTVLVVVAAFIRYRAESNPQLRIPPVETSELLPDVAKEMQQRQEAILADPQSAEAWGMYGLVLLAHGFRDQAAICFAEAEQIDDRDYRWPYYYGMVKGTSDTAQALDAFRRSVQDDPNRLATRMRLAEWLFDLRRLEQSEQQARAALQLDSNSPRAQLLIARLRFQEGKTEESLKWAQRAAAAAPRDRRDVHELLARLYMRLGDAEAAAQEVQRAEQLPRGVLVWDDPEMRLGGSLMRDASFLKALATIHYARGETTLWLQSLRQVVDREPKSIRAKEQYARALLETEQYAVAKTFIDQTLRQNPDFPQFHCLRGQVDLANGDAAAASKRFTRAAKLKPDYAAAYLWRGRAQLALQEPQAAVKSLREAVRLSPSTATAYDYLSQALLAVQDPADAIRQAQHAVKLEPRDLAMQLHLAQALVAADRTAEATQTLQAIVKADNAPPEAAQLLKTLTTNVEDVRPTDSRRATGTTEPPR